MSNLKPGYMSIRFTLDNLECLIKLGLNIVYIFKGMINLWNCGGLRFTAWRRSWSISCISSGDLDLDCSSAIIF